LLGYLYWDPDPDLIVLPIINHPIRWYGLFFVIGFLVAYRMIATILYSKLRSHPNFVSGHITDEDAASTAIKEGPASYSAKEGDLLGGLNSVLADGDPLERRETLEAQLGESVRTLRQVADHLTDRLAWFIVVGMIVGARLGHCFFYDWPRYSSDPLSIFRVWEGGLASHGGALGIIGALVIFRLVIRDAYPWLTSLTLLDAIVVPTGFVGFCIRCGNFVNQEVLGRVAQVPWAVIFGHPLDGSAPAPRHPAQLYEGIVYLGIFVLLGILSRRREFRTGVLTGLFFILTFGSRFILEFWKTPQTELIAFMHMGQLLSLPFILVGLILVSGVFTKVGPVKTL
jgi:phosphatidylglycerol:prolipoprotein diacylglycerol transferase